MTFVFAALGAKALYLLYAWLASAIVASYLSDRKGYGSKVGLAFGLVLSAIGALIWLLVPARADSRWKLQGAFGSGGKTVAEARAERDAASPEGEQ
jgi:fucose permease